MAYNLTKHNVRGLYELKAMGFNVMVRSMKPNYANVGFDLHGGGGHGSTLNTPWDL